MTKFAEIHALFFDVFGTCVDWRSGVARDVAAALPNLDAQDFADRWRAGYQPAMEPVRSGARPWVPLDTLHREVLLEVLKSFGIDGVPQALADELNLAWHRLDGWPDTVEGLERLRRKFVLAVLSNANIALMVDMCRHSGMRFDCMLGGEVARAYKPQPEVYANAAAVLGLRPDQCLMVAAHPYDLIAAADCGLRTAYVHRPFEFGLDAVRKRPTQPFDIMVDSFTELAVALGCS